MLKRLSDLPIGAKIKEANTKYSGRTLIWIIADKNHRGYPNNTVTLISEKVLLNRRFDGSTTTYKNSELRRWINNNNGLMKDFSSDFKNAIVDTSINTASGNVTDKMFLASRAEVGIEEDSAEGYKFPIFTNDSSRIGKDFNNKNKIWWLRTANGSAGVFVARSSGTDKIYYDSDGNRGVRPLCNLKSEILISNNKDSDGAYTLNKTPIIESTIKEDMGIQDKEFSFDYKVIDEDEGQTLRVEEYINDIKLKGFSATSGSTYTYKLERLAYQKLPNGNHKVKIVAIDSEGGVTEKVFNFSKNETKILFELEKPLVADAMVTKALITMVGSIPEKAILKIEACNNGHDKNPTWEDVTTKVVKERKIFFANKQKIAANWGVNVRVSVERNGAEGQCQILSIGGNFE